MGDWKSQILLTVIDFVYTWHGRGFAANKNKAQFNLMNELQMSLVTKCDWKTKH